MPAIRCIRCERLLMIATAEDPDRIFANNPNVCAPCTWLAGGETRRVPVDER